jgi:hypothetical protein
MTNRSSRAAVLGLAAAALALSPAAALDCTAPAEIGTLLAEADKVTFTWPAEPSATHYAVVRSPTIALPVGPGGGDEVCFPDLAAPSLVDETVPGPGFAFWYLVRGENACAGPYGARSDGTPRATTTCDGASADPFPNDVLATGFELPTKILFLPDGRMLVAELAGTIEVLPPPYTTPDPTPFLELDLNIPGYAGLQQGIMDVALDPDFVSNHYYYVFYTKDEPNRDRLSRFTANGALDGTIAGSEVLLYEDPDLANTEHHGGAVNFGTTARSTSRPASTSMPRTPRT